jgi:predicted ATP-dependent protease
MDRAQPTAPPGVLPPEALRRRCDARRLQFASTEELPDLDGPLGQLRALGAIEFGVGIRRQGYNFFAMGSEGVGRHTTVRRLLEEQAQILAAPADWCYVYNFGTPHKPRALSLPSGQACVFREKMERLVGDLRAAIPAAFESDEYRTRRQEIESELGERQEQAINEIGERARAEQVALLRTPGGFGFAPMREEKVISPEEFSQLPESEQKHLEALVNALQDELARVIHQVPKWRREALHRLRELNREVTRVVVNSLIEDLKTEYGEVPAVQAYLSEIQEDVLDHAELFRQPKEGEAPMLFGMPLAPAEAPEMAFRRYAVNVLIEHAGAEGAPIVYEDNPSHDALVGRIEHSSHMGTLVTDFTLIKSGALHRANGGYLVVDALKLLTQPFAWEALKRALRSREIRTESLGQALSMVSTVSLEPEAIPLDVKVALVGQRFLYYLLHAHDPEFAELFKVAVDFEEDMPRTPEQELLFARAVATLARKEGLRPFDCEAVARVIEQGARDVGDAAKLSLRVQRVADLLRESDYWAGKAGRSRVCAEDVQRAIRAQIERSDRVRERLQEQIVRGSLLIDTAGERTGQVNGLAVVQLGEFPFGTPHRITARAPRRGQGARHRARVGARRPDPLQGGAYPLGLSRRSLCRQQAAQPRGEPSVRAELRGRGGGQRLLRRALRAALGARRRSGAPVARRDGLGQPARRRAGDRRREREGRGLLRPLLRARAQRRARRADP